MSGGLFTNQLLRETAVEIESVLSGCGELMRGPINGIQGRSLSTGLPARASCPLGSSKHEFPRPSLPAANGGGRSRRA